MTQHMPMRRIGIPVPIYDRLKRAAKLTNRSVEDVLVATIDAALPPDPALPAELADNLAALSLFNDDALWAAAESSLSPAQQHRLEQLATTADFRSLTTAEFSELTQLAEFFDLSVLRRARALAILVQRGYQIPDQTAFDGGNNGGNSHPIITP